MQIIGSRVSTALVLFCFACGGSPPPGADDERPPWPRSHQPMPEVSFPEIVVPAGWVAAALEDGNLVPVDVRSPERYGAGHLPGAIRLDWPADCAGTGVGCLQTALSAAGLSGGERLALYGEGGDAGDLSRIGRLFWLLEWAGFERVHVLDGGAAAWAAEHALETTAPERAPAAFAAPASDRVVVDASWLEPRFGTLAVEVLDLRDHGIWVEKGYEAPPRFAGGHIPHALPYDFRPWVTGGTWPEPMASWRRLSDLGPRGRDYIRLDGTFVLYADGPASPRLGLAYLLLRRMDAPVRVLAGGMDAWTGSPDRPVVRIVEAEEVHALLERDNPGLARDAPGPRVVLLDLREEVEFRREHLPGARVVPGWFFEDRLEETLAEHWPGLDRRQATLLLYCYGRQCVRSREGCRHGARAGFTDLLWFREGLEAWQKAGRPVFSRPEPPDPSNSPPRSELPPHLRKGQRKG